MVFDSTVKIQSSVRSAIGRLRPSKSAVALASLFKSHSIPPVPDMRQNLSRKSTKSQTLADLWDPQFIESTTPNRSDKKVTKGAAGITKNRPHLKEPLPVLTQMLEQQGLLDSPISVHITSLIVVPCVTELSLFDAQITSRRSSSGSSYLENLLCTTSAGPFTPELVVFNTVGKSNPESCTSYFDIAEPQSCRVYAAR